MKPIIPFGSKVSGRSIIFGVLAGDACVKLVRLPLPEMTAPYAGSISLSSLIKSMTLNDIVSAGSDGTGGALSVGDVADPDGTRAASFIFKFGSGDGAFKDIGVIG